MFDSYDANNAQIGSESAREVRLTVLFICLGNICRSPAAEGVLQAQLRAHHLGDLVFVDSAGTADSQVGKRADQRMREVAAARGYELLSRARRIQRADLETFDLVVAMDRDNLEHIRQLHSQPTAAVHLLSDFLPAGWPVDVPDPYYGGRDGFELVLNMIEAACPQIVERLQLELNRRPPQNQSHRT